MTEFYFVEEMGSPYFQVVSAEGQVLGEISIIDAESLEYRWKRQGAKVKWVDRGLLKERKHVRDLIAKNSTAGNPQFSELGL